MYYFAFIDTSKNNICYDVAESEELLTGENVVQIDSLDRSLILRKKYIDGEWVDTTAGEAANYDARYCNVNGHWLDDAIGDIDDLATADKSSLVSALNECVSLINALTERVAELEADQEPAE